MYILMHKNVPVFDNTPKHLIKVNKKPMFVEAAFSMPSCDKWLFIIRDDRHTKTTLEFIKKFFSNYEIILLEEPTRGQAETCLKSEKYLKSNDLINISSCDSGFNFNKRQYDILSKEVDTIVWGYKGHFEASLKPESYGWIKFNKKKEIIKVSCKKKISNKPINDTIVIGTFTFRKASNFVDNTKLLINKKIIDNGEYYMDNVANIFIEKDLKAKVLLVNKFDCWGTPEELNKFYEKVQ